MTKGPPENCMTVAIQGQKNTLNPRLCIAVETQTLFVSTKRCWM